MIRGQQPLKKPGIPLVTYTAQRAKIFKGQNWIEKTNYARHHRCIWSITLHIFRWREIRPAVDKIIYINLRTICSLRKKGRERVNGRTDDYFPTYRCEWLGTCPRLERPSCCSKWFQDHQAGEIRSSAEPRKDLKSLSEKQNRVITYTLKAEISQDPRRYHLRHIIFIIFILYTEKKKK